MDQSEHHADELARFLALGATEAPRLQEYIVDGCAAGLARLQTAEGEDWIVACIDVGPVPAEHATGIHRLLLKANNLWSGTRGNTLGLYGDDDTVVLSQSMRAAEASPHKLEKVLDDLVADARDWRTWLQRLADEPSLLLD